MRYIKKNSREAIELNLNNRPSIDVSGSIRGMRKLYGWKGEVVKSGSYYYHISENR